MEMPAGKRKADAAPDGAGAPKAGRGGGGRGAGRKRKAENTPGVDDPERRPSASRQHSAIFSANTGTVALDSDSDSD